MRIKNISNFTTCRWKKFFLDITRKAKTKNAFRFYFKIFGRKTIFWITNVSTWVSSYNRPIFSFVMFAYRDMCLQFHMEDRRRTCECHQFLPTKTNTLMDLIIELEKKALIFFFASKTTAVVSKKMVVLTKLFSNFSYLSSVLSLWLPCWSSDEFNICWGLHSFSWTIEPSQIEAEDTELINALGRTGLLFEAIDMKVRPWKVELSILR